jgi:hypothetical protein
VDGLFIPRESAIGCSAVKLAILCCRAGDVVKTTGRCKLRLLSIEESVIVVQIECSLEYCVMQ